MNGCSDTVAEMANKLGISVMDLAGKAEQIDIDGGSSISLPSPLQNNFSGTFLHKWGRISTGGLFFVEGKAGEPEVLITHQS